jgi:hypothetical protein
MASTAEQRRRIAEIAKEMNELTGGRSRADGSLKTFAEIENDSIRATDLLAAEMMRVAAGDAPDRPSTCRCDGCGRVALRQADAEPRLVQTDRGEVGWTETTYYCRRCRQALSPSER